MKTIAVKCDSIQVEQYRMESKLCPEPTASLQGKEIYIGPSGQWKIKGKDLIAIHINAEQIIIETEKKLTFVLKQFQGATVAQANQWNSFGTNVNSLYQKYRSDPTQTFSKFLETSSRHNLGTGNFAKRSVLDVARKTDASRRGVFGSKGHANQTAKTLPMPWDDVGTTNVRQDDAQDIGIRHAKLISGGRKLKQLSKGELSSSDEEATVAQPVTGEKGHLIETRMDHHGSDMDNKDYHLEMVEKEQLLGTNKENEVGNERKRRRKLISKLKGRPKVLSDDDDTDDENIFDSKLDLTTPVAQRLVTPAGTNVSAASLKRENDDDNSDSETSVAIAIEKNQPRISNFFHARRPAAVCSFDPQKNIASASPVKTPPRFNLSANSARMVRAASAAKAKMKQLDQVSGTLWLRTSPARGQLSSAEKRKHELFGTVKRDCRAAVVQQNEDSGDPIEEYSVTPRRIALKRAVIGDRVLTSGENLSRLDLTSELASFGGSLKTQNKFRGLQNLGNTCYVNAALQMLYTCRDLISRLQRSNGGSLTKSVCWVAHQLEKANVPAMSPRIVKDAMDEKTDKFAGYEQRDAHEFLSDLLDFVHEELENVSRNDQATADEVSSGRKEKIYFPTDDFCLTAKVCLKCCTCGYSR